MGNSLPRGRKRAPQPRPRYRSPPRSATGILFGIAPALRATGIAIWPKRCEGRRIGRPQRCGLRLGKALVAAQVSEDRFRWRCWSSRPLRPHLTQSPRRQYRLRGRSMLWYVEYRSDKLGYRGHRLREFYDTLLERTRRIRGVSPLRCLS